MGKNKPIRILILEDTREDRQRFRHLLEDLRLSNDQFEFAWAWPEIGPAGPGVLEWIYRKFSPTPSGWKLIKILEESKSGSDVGWLTDYDLVLLDLAWSPDAEGVMRTMQMLPGGTGQKIATGENAFKKLVSHVEGIQFLEWWKELRGRKPLTWVTSAYLPTTASELRDFIVRRYPNVPIYHKWLDEESLKTAIKDHLRGIEEV